MKTLCLVLSELKMSTVFTRKNNGFSRLYDRKLTQSYSISQDGLNLSRQIPQPIASRVVTDSCQTWSDKIIFQTLASWFFRNKTLYACKRWLTNCKILPNSFAVLHFLWHGWCCTYGDVCCFGVELPRLQHSVTSSASAETLIASSELISSSFAKI